MTKYPITVVPIDELEPVTEIDPNDPNCFCGAPWIKKGNHVYCSAGVEEHLNRIVIVESGIN